MLNKSWLKGDAQDTAAIYPLIILGLLRSQYSAAFTDFLFPPPYVSAGK